MLPENRKLGLLPTPPHLLERRVFLANYVDRSALPALPQAVNGFQKCSRLTMMGNDQYGDCVWAGAMHLRQIWTANDSTESIIPDSDVVASYLQFNHGQDNGANLEDALDYWAQQGICDDKIVDRVAIDPNDLEMQLYAIWFFGGLFTGLNLPENWGSDLTHWSKRTATGQNEGGHCVVLGSFDQAAKRFGTYTWAHNVPTDFDTIPEFWTDLYAILDPDWYGADNVAPNGLNLDALRKDLRLVQGK